MKIVFFGSSQFVFPVIEMLKKHFELCLVITTDEDGKNSVLSFCKINKINVTKIANKEELNSLTEIRQLKPDIGVVADFGVIIPKEFLDLFPLGILNIHPSLLPKYRGPTPVQTAILNNEKITGVTIIKLDEQMDHGPILVQREKIISKNDTTENLLKILFRKGTELLENSLTPYQKGEIKLKEQDHEKATFTKILKRKDGFVDLSALKIKNLKFKIERKIRAFYPWPGVWTKLETRNSKLEIIKFLPGKKIQVEGKKPVSYKDFLNGYPDAEKKFIEFLKELSQ